MIDLGLTVAGRPLSAEVQELLKSYSDDLLDALIDATCVETKSRNSHKINENDALKSIKTVSLFPPRVVPRATLRIFDTSKPSESKKDQKTATNAPSSAFGYPASQSSGRSRRPVVDEATLLEDLRKLKPAEITEPQKFMSHKLTLDPKDIRPRVGPAAAAEVASAMERPARHFIGRPQPLITEDRGNVQAELTTYHRYRSYLGITGPMPNIKPNMGAMMKIPAFLQALQQRNEILGFGGGSTAPPQVPRNANAQVNQVQAPLSASGSAFGSAVDQRLYPQPTQPPVNSYQVPATYPVPPNIRQAIQRLQPQQAAQILNELLRKQQRQRFVDDLEQSALNSPTPPLTEYSYPPLAGSQLNLAKTKSNDKLALALSMRTGDGIASSVMPSIQEDSPPEEDNWENLEGPVDHLDCAAYYESINPKLKEKTMGDNSHRNKTGQNRDEGDQEVGPEQSKRKFYRPKTPSFLSSEEKKKFDECVSRLELIATMVQEG
ncbi:unnamed protein product [Cylicocyclus nassatus]|uniref:Uncharacterized protein n=1 Tax=Cylicocyclus nassatus TaxID=53992 RepID=A0AA36GN91_CYLNA|nr:unnamed protein product [Cylicocyclus nassatus]